MPIRSHTDLVPAAHSSIDPAKQARYRALRKKIPVERAKYYRTHNQVLQVANSYFDNFEEERDHVIRLRRDIRAHTRGAAATQAFDAITAAGYISNGTEQLYNAQSELVKTAYRAVAPLVHPDRSKYDAELFQQVRAAYVMHDLTFLQETYINLVHEHDPFWRQTKGIAYCEQELERPKVSLRLLQTTPEFGIARAHLTGRVEVARALAKKRLLELIVTLGHELHSLLTGQDDEGKDGESRDCFAEKSEAEGRGDDDAIGARTTGQESGDQHR
jgi:hypothetical protein